MQPRILIDDLALHYHGAVSELRRRQLDEVAVRELPALLDRLLAPLDDGRIIVVRHVVTRVRLAARPLGKEWVSAWAQTIADEVREQLTAARSAGALDDEAGPAVVFAGPLALLSRYIGDALDGRLERWYWQPEAGALAAAGRQLASLPASDGRSHAYAGAPAIPVAPTTAQAIEWALATAGAALPELVALLGARGAAALATVSAALATRLVDALAPATPSPALPVPGGSPLSSPAMVSWPAAAPEDPRNLLLVMATVVAERPSLRGAAGLRQAALATARRALHGDEPSDRPGPRSPTAPGEPGAIAARSSSSLREPGELPRSTAGLAPDAPAVTSASGDDGVAWSDAQRTRFAGLLFLLDPLRRLGLPAAIVDEPALATDPGLGLILYRVACRLAPEAWSDVAALVLLGHDQPAVARTPLDDDRRAALVRVEWRLDLQDPLPLTGDDALELAERAQQLPPSLTPSEWLDELCARLAARLCASLRRRLACDWPVATLLDRVLLRDGLVARTRTHVDVRLRLDSVDLEVRRAALDVDPGWVPWLGRVVSYHHV